MRILIVTNLYPNPFHPQRATFNREQFRALAREHELRVISPIAWTDELAARRAGKGPLPRDRRMEWDGIPVEYPRSLFIPRILRGLYGPCFAWSIRGAFRRAVHTIRPEVVLATWAYPDGWSAVKLAHRARLPVVLKVHGSDIHQLEKHPGRRRGTIEALQQADRVVAVSRDLARRVVELGADPDRVRLIYNGVDGAVFCPGDRTAARDRLGLASKRPILVYVGNLLPVKGPDVLVEAAGLLAARGIEFDLHIIGGGPLRAALERQVAERGVSAIFHGSIPHDHLPDWFRAADVHVLPSRSEGVPNVLLEAAACGTPFVASRVGGVPEVARPDTSCLVPPEDPGALADAIAGVLARPSARVESRKGRTHSDAAREFGCLFQELVTGERHVAHGTLFRLAASESAAPHH
jgi:glycosyltransferase involved in cell wall biosynthesis